MTQPEYIVCSPQFYQMFLDEVDLWRRELKRARKQLAKLKYS